MTHLTSNKASTAQPLWHDYLSGGKTDAARNALMEHYLTLVKFAAIRLASRNGRSARSGDVDDLMQYGVFGLRDAIRGFDPARGVKFETYCLQRVRGAMLDGLKSNQWLPREIRRRLTQFNRVSEQLHGEYGPGIHCERAAAELGSNPEDVEDLRSHNLRQSVASLDVPQDSAEEDISVSRTICDPREEDPEQTAQRRDVRELFMRELTRSERQIMILYYYENLTMREIGDVMGISGTRVSQIHTDIVNRLRERLASRVTTPTGAARDCMSI